MTFKPVHLFVLLASIAAGLVSYFPPVQNAQAIWALVASFLGFAAKHLFDADPVEPSAPAAAPEVVQPVTPTPPTGA